MLQRNTPCNGMFGTYNKNPGPGSKSLKKANLFHTVRQRKDRVQVHPIGARSCLQGDMLVAYLVIRHLRLEVHGHSDFIANIIDAAYRIGWATLFE